jgi:multiple sugar transport system ATP-binding protein
MVFLSINSTEVCGRTDPDAGAKVGSTLKVALHLDHMHLIDNSSGRVL